MHDPQQSLESDSDRELIPLPEATAVAYDLISNRQQPVRDPGDLEETRGLIALALSALAPLYVLREGGAPVPLSTGEIEEKICITASQRQRYGTRDIDRIYIRRGDFIRAVENLQTARSSFERP
jgi:hypothetical protein